VYGHTRVRARVHMYILCYTCHARQLVTKWRKGWHLSGDELVTG
jgi:hypothetical protein